ncbi:MAG: acyl-CoA dehydrogenase family protein, partial [Acidimicrobiia bacterium]
MTTDPETRAELIATVRRFVEGEVLPVASDLEHADEYPAAIVAGMREMG